MYLYTVIYIYMYYETLSCHFSSPLLVHLGAISSSPPHAHEHAFCKKWSAILALPHLFPPHSCRGDLTYEKGFRGSPFHTSIGSSEAAYSIIDTRIFFQPTPTRTDVKLRSFHMFCRCLKLNDYVICYHSLIMSYY